VLDYDFIRRTITERVKRGHIHLQETLADDVLAS
jgi:dihydroneopterin aldolase